MIRALAISLLPLLALARGPVQSPNVVDAIAAVVNGAPILRSEAETAAWYARLSAALGGGDPAAVVPPLTAAEKHAALQHLVDEQLVLQARRDEGFGPPSAAQVQAAMAQQWNHLQQAAGGAARLQSLLPAFRLDHALAAAEMQRQWEVAQFLDQHARSSPATDAVTAQQIEHYYASDFVPAAQRRHLAPAPLAQVRDQITRILRQQQRDAAGEQWLAQLRAAARLEVMPW